MKEVVEGSIFIDLGCGDPEVSIFPRRIAEVFGALEYQGVDLRISGQKDEQVVTDSDTGFRVTFFQQDMLAFLKSKLTADGRKKTFFISGIEPKERLSDSFQPKSNYDQKRVEQDKAGRQFTQDVIEEITERTISGDTVIIGVGTHGFDDYLLRDGSGFILLAEVEAPDKYGEAMRIGSIYVRE